MDGDGGRETRSESEKDAKVEMSHLGLSSVGGTWRDKGRVAGDISESTLYRKV